MEEKIKRQISLISESLVYAEKTSLDLSLFCGKAGYSLFKINEKLISNSREEVLFLIQNYFDETFLSLQNNKQMQGGYNLCLGYSGIIWYYSYLVNLGFAELGTLDSMENQLLNSSLNDLRNGEYDYLHYSLGLALAISNRNVFDKVKLDYFDSLIEILDDNKKDYDSGIAWVLNSDPKNPNAYEFKTINLSLSHGIPSIICLLSKLIKIKDINPKAKYLLENSVNFLLSLRLKKDNNVSLYPVNCYEDGTIMEGFSRLGWCYGDLGIAIALWNAGKALDRSDLKNEALEILIHSTKRLDLKQNAIKDACLCHGTSGMAHIYNRFYKETKLKEFDDARLYWLNETLKMSKYDDGIAGYKTWEESGWKNNDSLLEGVTGIGLALLGFLSENPEDLNWDTCLLLS
ncbi:MAG: lanthionine synthetase C family protein [Sphingobacteriaceae bacterium]|nr:lanthionine synthetase C family protein [Sphingobacteriaceae bacterium]